MSEMPRMSETPSEPPHAEEPPFHTLSRLLPRARRRARVYDLTVGPQHLNRAQGWRTASWSGAARHGARETAVVAAILPRKWCGTLQLSVQFREPILPGAIVAEGRMASPRSHPPPSPKGKSRPAAGRSWRPRRGSGRSGRRARRRRVRRRRPSLAGQ